MNKRPLISFVIPVYNVKDYINECVDSILKQNFDDYEIILVDDGSTDESSIICDLYEQNNDHVRTIHKKNSGPADARNLGQLSAKGDYILFVDSDDYLINGALTDIANILKSSKEPIDIVILRICRLYKNGDIKRIPVDFNGKLIVDQPRKTVMKHLCSCNRFPAAALYWKIIRRELLIENNIIAESGIYSQDIEFTLSLYKYAKKYSYCDTNWYVHRDYRSNSITSHINIKHIESMIFIFRKWAFEDIHKDRFQFVANTLLSNEYAIALYYFSLLEKKDQQKVISELREYKWLLKFANNKRTKITRLCVSLFGIRATSILLNKLKKII